MYSRRIVALVLLGLVAGSPGTVSSQKPAEVASEDKALAQTSSVSCLDENGNMIGRRRERSAVLVSPDRRMRAHVEVVVSVNRKEDFPICTNSSAVYVARDTEGFQLIHLETPTLDEPGNGIELVDWSADSRYLLCSVFSWAYETDAADFKLLVFDSQLGIFIRPNHNNLFSQQLGKKCTIEVWGIGFTSDNRVVFRASDHVELGSEDLSSQCVGDTGLWQLDWRKSKVQRLASDYRPRRYGRVQPPLK